MRKKWIWAVGCVLLACVLVACTTKNMEKQKQIAEKTRLLGEAYLPVQAGNRQAELFGHLQEEGPPPLLVRHGASEAIFG